MTHTTNTASSAQDHTAPQSSWSLHPLLSFQALQGRLSAHITQEVQGEHELCLLTGERIPHPLRVPLMEVRLAGEAPVTLDLITAWRQERWDEPTLRVGTPHWTLELGLPGTNDHMQREIHEYQQLHIGRPDQVSGTADAQEPPTFSGPTLDRSQVQFGAGVKLNATTEQFLHLAQAGCAEETPAQWSAELHAAYHAANPEDPAFAERTHALIHHLSNGLTVGNEYHKNDVFATMCLHEDYEGEDGPGRRVYATNLHWDQCGEAEDAPGVSTTFCAALSRREWRRLALTLEALRALEAGADAGDRLLNARDVELSLALLQDAWAAGQLSGDERVELSPAVRESRTLQVSGAQVLQRGWITPEMFAALVRFPGEDGAPTRVAPVLVLPPVITPELLRPQARWRSLEETLSAWDEASAQRPGARPLTVQDVLGAGGRDALTQRFDDLGRLRDDAQMSAGVTALLPELLQPAAHAPESLGLALSICRLIV